MVKQEGPEKKRQRNWLTSSCSETKGQEKDKKGKRQPSDKEKL
jgi:hypothetical protein